MYGNLWLPFVLASFPGQFFGESSSQEENKVDEDPRSAILLSLSYREDYTDS